MRAVIYARVSSDEQADRGLSIPTQIKLCGDFVNDLLKTPLKIKIKRWT